MFHYCEWRLWGLKADYIAWKALTKQVTFSDASLAMWKDGARRGGETQGRKNASNGHLSRIAHINTPARMAARTRNANNDVKSGRLKLIRDAKVERQREARERLCAIMEELREGGYKYKDIAGQFIDMPYHKMICAKSRNKKYCDS